MSLSLIVAIGAQNAFILKQGIRGQHMFLVCLLCAAADALLIAAGVSGFQTLLQRFDWIDPVARYAGAAFLLWYGLRSLRAALGNTQALHASSEADQPLARTLAICLALTFLNPHVYLDTVVLMGSISARFPEHGLAFWGGASLASFSFFFTLGYGARLLRPLFARPQAWKVLDLLICAVMWSIALMLLVGESA
ncbi:LysE/ArgO family amino acid transporter [Herbaspirillum sp.]|uniref:LysE/ArgO family amino acid transporter n=1 Tax=Herbaspirillum sp. TaxID=1890675 RepID=UPI001B1C8EE7|nr:LysE/ArgO family amino acid transporter [Herbaspirillum sp.]MBO9536906.1 amino acid transporter [Herbaspirillum sp.]